MSNAAASCSDGCQLRPQSVAAQYEQNRSTATKKKRPSQSDSAGRVWWINFTGQAAPTIT